MEVLDEEYKESINDGDVLDDVQSNPSGCWWVRPEIDIMEWQHIRVV